MTGFRRHGLEFPGHQRGGGFPRQGRSLDLAPFRESAARGLLSFSGPVHIVILSSQLPRAGGSVPAFVKFGIHDVFYRAVALLRWLACLVPAFMISTPSWMPPSDWQSRRVRVR
jgi:hypothetical protein